MKDKESVLFTKKELKNFCTYRFLFGISYSLMIPIIPLFYKSIGIPTIIIGMIISLYGVSKTIIQIPFGIVSDKLGDKLTLKIALGLMALVPIGYTLAKNNMVAGSIYIIQGAILGMAAPATYSILSRSIDERKRGESTGLASAVFTFGGGIGAIIGALIVTKLNNFSKVFYITSLGILITLIYVTFKISKAKTIKEEKKMNVALEEILKEINVYKLKHKVMLLGAMAFLGDYIYSCVVALIHFYGQSVLGVSTLYTSWIISIYLMVFGLGAPIAGWVSDRIGNKAQLALSFTTMNLSLLFLVITRNISVFTITIIIYFLGATFLNAVVQSSLSEFGANPKIKGFVFGVVGSCESLGYALGPLISSCVYEHNKQYLFLGLLIVSVLVTVLYVLFSRKAKI